MAPTTQIQDAHAALQAFDEIKRAIVVCAHADDMETMMGGTIWLLAKRGVQLYELICTQGDLGSHDERYTGETLAAERASEAQEGGRLLGLQQITTLSHHDGELAPTLELRSEIAWHYRKWQPDTLFTFDPSWLGQIHPDHIAAGRAAIDALMPSKMRLYKPDQLQETHVADIKRAFLFSPASPTLFIDVSEVYDRKLTAALAHKSQFLEGEKSLEWMRELDRVAARRGNTVGEYAEQFAPLRVW